MIDAHEIVPGLWQGSKPRPGSALGEAGFQVAVFCAREYQPSPVYFPGVQVIHAPNDDIPIYPLTPEDLKVAVQAATRVARHLAKGRKVLVTCLAGINRSGLVVALALHKAYGYSGRTCIEIVRSRRLIEDYGLALSNEHFVEALSKLSGEELIVLSGIPPLHVP